MRGFWDNRQRAHRPQSEFFNRRMEGGYAVDALGANVAGFLSGF
ncbi:MAG TPA: hypothetical protein VMN38_09535 [Sphingomicrobium sp.]|nr:hypothetical protein [Sphingomicrobium sp.]